MHKPEDAGLHWFYVRDGRRVGPFERAPLVAQLLALDAPEAVLVWRTGLPAWTKAGLLDELRGELPPPVPAALPGQDGPLDLPDPDPAPPDASAGEPLPPLPSESMSDGDFAGDLGEGHRGSGESATPSDEAGRRRKRRRHHHRTSGPRKLPDYLLPIVLLFLAVMLGLWFLLRRMNEPPPGQILHQGWLAPVGAPLAVPEPTGSLPGGSRA